MMQQFALQKFASTPPSFFLHETEFVESKLRISASHTQAMHPTTRRPLTISLHQEKTSTSSPATSSNVSLPPPIRFDASNRRLQVISRSENGQRLTFRPVGSVKEARQAIDSGLVSALVYFFWYKKYLFFSRHQHRFRHRSLEFSFILPRRFSRVASASLVPPTWPSDFSPLLEMTTARLARFSSTICRRTARIRKFFNQSKNIYFFLSKSVNENSAVQKQVGTIRRASTRLVPLLVEGNRESGRVHIESALPRARSHRIRRGSVRVGANVSSFARCQ